MLRRLSIAKILDLTRTDFIKKQISFVDFGIVLTLAMAHRRRLIPRHFLVFIQGHGSMSDESSQSTSDPIILPWAKVWEEEQKALGYNPYNIDQPSLADAICLSGGGIRSAAFCLGVLQVLSTQKLLPKFHYLSTVSGGGYIACWLTRMIADSDAPGHQPAGTVEEADIFAALELNRGTEPPQLTNLRRNANYLTPKPGPVSSDSWTGIVLWVRNTLITWAIFLPLFLSVAALCIAYVSLSAWLSFCQPMGHAEPSCVVQCLLYLISFLGLLAGVFFTCIALPSHLPNKGSPESGWHKKEVRWTILTPSLLWFFCAPLVLAPILQDSTHLVGQAVVHDILQPIHTHSPRPSYSGKAASAKTELPVDRTRNAIDSASPQSAPVHSKQVFSQAALRLFCAAYWLVLIAAYFLAWPYVSYHHGDAEAFKKSGFQWSIVSLASAVVLYGAGRILADYSIIVLAIAGPAVMAAIESLRTIIYVAVRNGGIYNNLDREWLARLSAYKIKIIVLVSIFLIATVELPRLLLGYTGLGLWTLTLGSGPLAAFLGAAPRSVFTYLTGPTKSRLLTTNRILGIVSGLFLIVLLVFLGRFVEILVGCFISRYAAGRFGFLLFAGGAFGLAVAGIGVALFVDKRVWLNHFSMHAVYRNRLVRAFLGAARKTRAEDPFTNFDPLDNIRLGDIWPREKVKGLFPVINVTLSRTSGKDTARAERRGVPFTITPLHCGSERLKTWNKKTPHQADAIKRGAYIATKSFAKGERDMGIEDSRAGITLGTAMTISGAALSPNMGYSGSPFTSFLMTLFNLRLGAWLPNPGAKRPASALFDLSGPERSIPYLWNELCNTYDDRKRFIYLSDGGHFDNLGLYEMLRRRCKHILVIDAGRDSNYAYTDLGHTLQCALVDLGVEVTFETKPRTNKAHIVNGFHLADISYPASETLCADSGCLIYLKAYLPKDIPIELQAYRELQPEFPNETTANQFFTESDFESYRRLGEVLTKDLLKDAIPRDGTIEQLFTKISRKVKDQNEISREQ